jgi:hypothetical protein
MACDPKLVRLGLELGLAVNDFNAGSSETIDDVVKTTLAYLEEVKAAFKKGCIHEEELTEFFALVGQSWASIKTEQREQTQPKEKK